MLQPRTRLVYRQVTRRAARLWYARWFRLAVVVMLVSLNAPLT